MSLRNSRHQYLVSTDVINWEHPEVLQQARTLAAGNLDLNNVARRCFEWVRDEIRHSLDYCLNPVTCIASDVLRERTGFCYAKSHLLAALLRANRIPAGFCYQRLSLDEGGQSFCLHGLNAISLADVGWYRIDPRGNRPGIDAQFDPPIEHVAFRVQLAGEADLSQIWSDPLPCVVEALRKHATFELLARNLPDVVVARRTVHAARRCYHE